VSPPHDAINVSYACCRRMARRAASNFVPCFLLLPPKKRRAMHALYAFMRHTDDLADNGQPLDARRRGLAVWRTMLEAAFSDPSDRQLGGTPKHDAAELHDAPGQTLLPALADTVRQFRIPAEHLHAVIDGVQMDLDRNRYETFDELAEYCRRVASAVGLACIHVWGFRGDQALESARKCGIALQVTNILRDLKEDAERGRIYLPAEDLDRFGYSPEHLTAGVVDEPFLRLMEYQTGRARHFYHEGADLIDWLEPDGRRVFGMMLSIYHRLLDKIARRPGEVLLHRVRLNRWQKLAIAARWALLPPRRTALP